MQITTLDHVNIRTNNLTALVAWYRDVLGLIEGYRPDFAFPGAWMYAGDAALVHLVGVEENDSIGSEVALKLEHFAFRAKGCSEFEERLQTSGAGFRKVVIEQTKTIAFNVWDPDGNHIHVDFDADE